ncbi:MULTISPECIES: hypothetical protein [Kitasatospora]|uniref:Secreted protein n=1 Tax=Kitasatospora cystarginea TaxID=58350 RepID=A0ABN3E0I8_9ACTN
MRRVATLLAALATTSTLALAVPTSAYAAHGQLLFFSNDRVVNNPSVCVNQALGSQPMENRTTAYVLVYEGAKCSGNVLAVVPPGGTATESAGKSVYVA